MNSAKGYIDSETCLDGTNSHKWEDTIITEDGMKIPVTHCILCGFWQ